MILYNIININCYIKLLFINLLVILINEKCDKKRTEEKWGWKSGRGKR